MSLAKRLEAMRERAQREIYALDDDVLLSSRHVVTPEEIAERHYLAPVRLGRASFDTPRPIKMAVPGDPGQEAPGGSPIVVPGTRVDLFVGIEGGETLAFLHEEDDELEHASIEIDLQEHRLVIAYVAEHPNAGNANRFFESSLRAVEADVERANEVVREFNESLAPTLVSVFEVARERATERRRLASGLKPPTSYERWWGRP
jgi:hypothetical protein